MGLFDKIKKIMSSEGCREAMRLSYKKHLSGARHGIWPKEYGTPSYWVGLYGALASRYKGYGISVGEREIWEELLPFLLMSEQDAPEALAEYVVYKERPNEAKVSWLKNLINNALQRLPYFENSYKPWLVTSAYCNMAWFNLLDEDIVKVMDKELFNQYSEDKSTMEEEEDVNFKGFKPGSEPDGFRGIEWGTYVSSLKDMEYIKTGETKFIKLYIYKRKGEDLRIGRAKLKNIIYFFWEGKLFAVSIHTKAFSNWSYLKKAIFQKFGKGFQKKKNKEYYEWEGKTTVMTMAYDETSREGHLFLRSVKISKQKEVYF